MERVGTVDTTAQGLLIVRCGDEHYPAIGTMVVDESLGTVGRVVDVFGPVSKPYVAITPTETENVALMVGTKLYAR